MKRIMQGVIDEAVTADLREVAEVVPRVVVVERATFVMVVALPQSVTKRRGDP